MRTKFDIYVFIVNSCVLLTFYSECGKHLNDCNISLGNVWPINIINPFSFFGKRVPSSETSRSCICTFGVSF